jgi:conjugal transfer mating pair stabilization protein TraN
LNKACNFQLNYFIKMLNLNDVKTNQMTIKMKIPHVVFMAIVFITGAVNANIFDPENENTQWVCGSDLNGNGYVGESGETALCSGVATDKYCPIGSAMCVTDTDTKTAPSTCGEGDLNSEGICEKKIDECKYQVGSVNYHWTELRSRPITYIIWGNEGYWGTNLATGAWIPPPSYIKRGRLMSSENSWVRYEICMERTIKYEPTCEDGFSYSSENNQCEQTISIDVCPIGDYACVADGSAHFCSPHTCIDKNDDTNSVVDDLDGKLLIDDGEKNNEGLCLDQVFIYSGRKQRCLKSGVESAFQNCCKDKGKVFQDNAGSISSIGTTAGVISDVYKMAEIAYITYEAQTAAGVGSAFASELAANAAQQQLMVAFDPTSIAISVAMYFVMEWVANACDQMDLETAMANSSGYCVEVGEFCKKDVKFIGCIQKARSFCCFNSKLARIIQEQGRPQLTTIDGFGTPVNPQCRGFTPEEFQRLDFSKIDLTEYVEDLQKNTQLQVEKEIQDITEDFFNKVK